MNEEWEWRKDRAARNAPWCDTCRNPAVWTEGRGWVHATVKHPFGTWESSDHEVTAREWSAEADARSGWGSA